MLVRTKLKVYSPTNLIQTIDLLYQTTNG